MTLSQCARGDSLQEEGGVAEFSEADRDAMEAREDVWSMSGEFIYRHNVVPENNCMYRERSLFTNSVKIY